MPISSGDPSARAGGMEFHYGMGHVHAQGEDNHAKQPKRELTHIGHVNATRNPM